MSTFLESVNVFLLIFIDEYICCRRTGECTDAVVLCVNFS